MQAQPSDRQAQLAIASPSFGATCRCSLKHRSRRNLPRLDLALAAGSLLLVASRCQDCWLHRLPKTKRPVGEPINLTFRPWTGDRAAQQSPSQQPLGLALTPPLQLH